MAKGAESKQIIINKILETFPGSFLYNDGKELRIPMMEGGEQIQIKCTFTCSKVNVESGSDTAIPDAGNDSIQMREITPEEKEEVRNLIAELDL